MKYYLSILLFSFCLKSYSQFNTFGSSSKINSLPCATGSDCYRLTSDTIRQAGSVWSTNTINFNKAFDGEFCVYLGNPTISRGCSGKDPEDNGADGMLIGFKSTTASNVGAPAGGLSYAGITSSFGIELDTYPNNGNGDFILADHTSLVINGNLGSPVAGPTPLNPGGVNAEDGAYHTVRITWDPSTFVLSMYFDGILRFSHTQDFVSTIFSNNPYVQFGATGATGGCSNLQTICFPLLQVNVPDVEFCTNDSSQLSYYDKSLINYLWTSPLGDTLSYWDSSFSTPLVDTSIFVKQPGNYNLRVINLFDTLEDIVNVTVHPLPSLYLGQDTVLCKDSSIVLDALNPTGSFLWNNGATTQRITSNDSTKYWVQVTDTNNCVNYDTLIIEIQNGQVNFLADRLIGCAPMIVNFSQTSTVDPGFISSHNWDFGNGSNSSLPNDSTTYNNVGSHSTKLTITSNYGCIFDTTYLNYINTLPFAIADAGQNDTICIGDTGTFQLGATSVSGLETGEWSQLSGANTGITTPSQANTSITGLIAGSYEYIWTVRNGFCDSTDTVSILVLPLPIADAGNDDTICLSGVSTFQLGATSVSGLETGEWSQLSGANTGITTPSQANTGITGLVAGSYEYIWTVSNGFCDSTDTVSILVLPLPIADAGNDDTVCLSDASTFQLGATSVSGLETGEWRQLSGANTGITTPSQSNTSITGLIAGNYEYIWTVRNDFCASVTDTVSILVLPLPIADAGNDDTVCLSDASTFQLGATSVSGLETGEWRQLSGANTGITTPSQSNTSITGLIAGNYEYIWTVRNDFCASVTDTVSILVLPLPIADAGNDDTICLSGVSTFQLGATSVSGLETGEWSQLSGANTGIITPSQSNTSITGLIAGSYEYIWTVSNGFCDSTDTVSILVLPLPIADAGNDDTICLSGVSTFQLGATSVSGLETGEWSQLSGGATGITTPSQTNTSITGLIAGSYEYIWTVSNGFCDSTDTVSILVLPLPIADAGNDDTICLSGVSTFQLGATSVSGLETGEWSQLSGGATGITTPSQSNTRITGLIAGSYEYIWRVSNGFCDSTDTVSILVLPLPIADAGNDDTICLSGVSTFQLGATSVSGLETGEWSQLSGGATGITTPSQANTSITGLIAGSYEYIWTVSNGFCDSTDTVSILVLPLPIADAGNDDTVCLSDASTFQLGSTSVSGLETGEWSQLSGANTGITTPSQANTSITGLIAGSYEYIWTVSNGFCDSTDTVSILVLPLPIADAGNDDTICLSGVSTFQLGATLVSGSETGEWSQLSGANTGITTPSQANTSITGLIAGSYEYIWTVSNGFCDSTDTVSILVLPLPIADAGNDDTICLSGVSTFQLGATSVSGSETGEWSQLSGANTGITTPSQANTSITGLVAGSYEYIWTVSNGFCDSTDTVSILVLPLPIADAGNDDTICLSGVSTFQLGSTSVSGLETGEWSQLSGANTGITTPSQANTGITGLVAGSYEYIWTVSNGFCDSTDTVSILVLPLPIADAGNDDTICLSGANTFQLGATSVSGLETGEWRQLSGGATGITTPSQANTSITGLIAGSYEYIWTVRNGFCDSATDTVSILVLPLPIADAGNDDTICLSGVSTFQLGATSVSGLETGEWSQLSGANTGITTPSQANTGITGLVAGSYEYIWTVSNGFCDSTTDTVRVTVYEPSLAIAGKDIKFCTLDSMSLFSINSHTQTYHNYTWTFNSAGSKYSTTPIINTPENVSTSITNLDVGIYSFVLEVDNGGYCSSSFDTIQVTVLALPNVDFLIDDESVCLGDCSDFTNLTTVLDSSGSTLSQYQWSFGDNNGSSLSYPIHCYDNLGSYDVKLVVTSNEGCVDSLVKSNYVQVNPLPVAGFTVKPRTIMAGYQVIITDSSSGVDSYLYNLGNGDFASVSSPITRYVDAGYYTIEQVVINFFGCRDSISKTIEVIDEAAVFIPNVFTPNNNSLNDIFKPALRGVSSENYNFMIFNRWGEKIYETTVLDDGWDGSHRGEIVSYGVYVYVITFVKENEPGIFQKRGHVTLIR